MMGAADPTEAWRNRVDKKLDDIGSAVAELRTLQQRVDDHNERIYGNGQPGIIKDVDRLKQSHRAASEERRRAWWVWLVIAFGAGGAGSSVAEFARSAIQTLLR